MGQDKEIFTIVLETHVIDPNLHVGKNVINGVQYFSKTVNFLERAIVWEIINLKLLYSGV